MADLDLETEYSPRLTIPDHPEIFARWARAAEDYRAEMLKAGRAELGFSYGDSLRQFIDLFFPAAGESAPLAIFIHGGYWRAMDPSFHSHMARGLNERGFAVGVVGYDLCPIVTIADIVEQIRRACASLWQRFNRRMLVCGHSAGGHLTAAMVATDWQKLWPKVPSDLVPVGYAISGVFDLTPLTKTSMNQDFRLDDQEAIGHAGCRLPAGSRMLELSPCPSMADAWRQAKAETRYAELPGNHFTVIDALADPKNAMVARIAELARRISA